MENERITREVEMEEERLRKVALAKVQGMISAGITKIQDTKIVENLTQAVSRFEAGVKETNTQVGGKTHKCVTMKRVCNEWLVVDHQGNKVGFAKAHSLAMIEERKFEVEGYLTGVFGIKSDGKKYIYLWFSSGDIILVHGDSLEQLSQLVLDDCTVSQMIAFKNT